MGRASEKRPRAQPRLQPASQAIAPQHGGYLHQQPPEPHWLRPESWSLQPINAPRYPGQRAESRLQLMGTFFVSFVIFH